MTSSAERFLISDRLQRCVRSLLNAVCMRLARDERENKMHLSEEKKMLTSAYMPATEHETSRLQQAHWSSRAILGHGVGQRWTTTCDTSDEKVCLGAACFISSRRGVRRWNPSALAAYLPATGGGRADTKPVPQACAQQLARPLGETLFISSLQAHTRNAASALLNDINICIVLVSFVFFFLTSSRLLDINQTFFILCCIICSTAIYFSKINWRDTKLFLEICVGRTKKIVIIQIRAFH